MASQPSGTLEDENRRLREKVARLENKCEALEREKVHLEGLVDRVPETDESLFEYSSDVQDPQPSSSNLTVKPVARRLVPYSLSSTSLNESESPKSTSAIRNEIPGLKIVTGSDIPVAALGASWSVRANASGDSSSFERLWAVAYPDERRYAEQAQRQGQSGSETSIPDPGIEALTKKMARCGHNFQGNLQGGVRTRSQQKLFDEQASDLEDPRPNEDNLSRFSPSTIRPEVAGTRRYAHLELVHCDEDDNGIDVSGEQSILEAPQQRELLRLRLQRLCKYMKDVQIKAIGFEGSVAVNVKSRYARSMRHWLLQCPESFVDAILLVRDNGELLIVCQEKDEASIKQLDIMQSSEIVLVVVPERTTVKRRISQLTTNLGERNVLASGVAIWTHPNYSGTIIKFITVICTQDPGYYDELKFAANVAETVFFLWKDQIKPLRSAPNQINRDLMNSCQITFNEVMDFLKNAGEDVETLQASIKVFSGENFDCVKYFGPTTCLNAPVCLKNTVIVELVVMYRGYFYILRDTISYSDIAKGQHENVNNLHTRLMQTMKSGSEPDQISSWYNQETRKVPGLTLARKSIAVGTGILWHSIQEVSISTNSRPRGNEPILTGMAFHTNIALKGANYAIWKGRTIIVQDEGAVPVFQRDKVLSYLTEFRKKIQRN